METILQQIQNNIVAATAIVTAVAAFIVVIITKYKEIKEMIDTIKNSAVNKATVKAIPETASLIAKAMTDPQALAHELVNKEAMPTDQPISVFLKNNPDEAKKNIVAQALIEKKPKLLKKMKLKDILQVGNFVNDVYQMVKPIIKGK